MSDSNGSANRLAGLEGMRLLKGQHASREDGMCAMEVVAWLAGEPHSDNPECASPVIAAFLRTWNDYLPDVDRTRLLLPLLPRLVGSKSLSEIEQRRSYMVLDWLTRVYTPAWVSLHEDLRVHAIALRGLSPIVDKVPALAANRLLHSTEYTTCNLEGNYTHSTVMRAIQEAAWEAAWDAAWNAARYAEAKTVVGYIREAAWNVVWTTAKRAPGGRLKPTKELLQRSALDLIERMLTI